MPRPTELQATLGTMILSLTMFAAPLFAYAAEPAASAGAAAAAKGTYEQERARCLAGQSGQALDTCLREAGAAKAQGKAALTVGDGHLGADAKARCDALSGSQKRDCLARVDGAANTSSSGSVKSGGIIRETVTTVPAPPAPAASR